MPFNAAVNARARGRRYQDIYYEMLYEIQAIQRQFPNEKAIPQNNGFWRKKADLFDLIEMHGNRVLDVLDKEPAVREQSTTARSRKAGTARSVATVPTEVHPADRIGNGIAVNNQR